MFYNKVLMNKGEYELGEEILRKLTLVRPDDPEVWYWLAEVQGLDKNLIGLHLSRAEYFFLTGNYDTSIKHLRMALELTGNNYQLTESIHNKIERSHKSIVSSNLFFCSFSFIDFLLKDSNRLSWYFRKMHYSSLSYEVII